MILNKIILTDLRCLSDVYNIIVRDDGDSILESLGVGGPDLVLNVDEGLDSGGIGEDVPELGQEVVGGDDRCDFGFIYSVCDGFVTQCGVDCDN